MISNHPYRQMRIPEKQVFATKIAAAANKAKKANPDLGAHIQAVECHTEALKKAYERMSDNPIAAEMVEADDMRDNGLINLREYAAICASHHNVEWVRAGETILGVFKDISWDIHRLRNPDESIRVDNLLIILKTYPKLKKAIATMHAQHWVEEIEEGQLKFKEAHEKFKEQNENVVLIDLQPIVKNLGVALERLFQYINMRLEFMPNPELYNLAHKINDLIAAYKAKMMASTNNKSE